MAFCQPEIYLFILFSLPKYNDMCIMKKFTLLSAVCFLCFSFNSHAQLMKKLKDKVNNAVNKSTTSPDADQANQSSSNTSSGKPTNTKGGGLTNTTPPDVNQQIADAEKSQAAGSYSDAR